MSSHLGQVRARYDRNLLTWVRVNHPDVVAAMAAEASAFYAGQVSSRRAKNLVAGRRYRNIRGWVRVNHPDVYAATIEEAHQFFGGRTPRTRPIPHGTANGYQRHHQEGSDPCDACKAGHNQRISMQRARRRAERHAAAAEVAS